MTTDERIEMLLDQGDVEGACELAGTLPKPAAYLAAMLKINQIIDEAKRRKPVIAITNMAAKLVKFTPYVELHGKEVVPGAALRLEFNTDGTFLHGFDDTLRAFLFHKLGARQHDLASQTAEAPDLRFEKMKPPFLWRQRYDGSTLTIHIGDREENAIVLESKIKKPFSLTPMQGGTLVVGMTVHCHPDTKQAGTIYNLQRNEVRISFEPGEEVEDEGEEEEETEGAEE